MNLKSTLIAAACLAVSGTAGAQGLELSIDPDTGAVQLINTSGAAIQFDGYTIASESGSLDVSQWNTFQAAVIADAGGFIARFGAGGLGLAPSGADSNGSVSELTSGDGPLFGAGEVFSLGNLFNPAGTRDVTLEYNVLGSTTGTTMGEVNYIPEPGSLALLTLGGLALVRRRR